MIIEDISEYSMVNIVNTWCIILRIEKIATFSFWKMKGGAVVSGFLYMSSDSTDRPKIFSSNSS